MNTTTISATAILALSSILTAQAIPPALGPPAASIANGTKIPVLWFMTEPLRSELFVKINELNNELKAKEEIDKVRAYATASVSTNGIWTSATALPGEPNHRFVNVPHHITITISGIAEKKAGLWVPYPWNRTVIVNTDMMAFCRGWETGTGQVTIESNSQTPYLDADPSFSEQFVNFFLNHSLTAKVDAKVRAALRNVQIESTASGVPSECNALTYDSGVAGPDDDKIVWQKLLPYTSLLSPSFSVKPVKIKRLAARNLNGGVLYDAVETPLVDFWAGYTRTSFQVNSMTEGQEISLAATPAITTRIPNGASVLLTVASMNYSGNGLEDNAFRTFNGAANFGIGTQTIILKKVYTTITPGQKPVKWYVPAYEITFTVTQAGGLAQIGPGLISR
ncbi:MAG: hypothetical protein FJW30_19135 [Acidobacteria bacterium]|nr:hypothetical protein [Acidobacteriota bacterium]